MKFLNAQQNRRCIPSRSTSRKKKTTWSSKSALQYNDSYNEQVFSFVNNINTIEGGTHLTGFRSALTRVINDYVKKNELLKDKTSQHHRRRRARRP